MVLLRVNIFFPRLVLVLENQAEQEGPGSMNVPIARSHCLMDPAPGFGPLLHAHTDIIVLVVAEILASTLNSLCWWVGHQTYWGVFVWTRGIYIYIDTYKK